MSGDLGTSRVGWEMVSYWALPKLTILPPASARLLTSRGCADPSTPVAAVPQYNKSDQQNYMLQLMCRYDVGADERS